MFGIVNSNNDKAVLLALGTCASFIEIGPIIQLIRLNAGLMDVLLVGLFYQLGNASPHPQALGRVSILIPMALAAAGLYLFTLPASAPWYASVYVLGWSIQYVRRWLGSNNLMDRPSTAQKRTARVVGFASVALLAPAFWLFVVAITLAWAALKLRRRRPDFKKIQMLSWRPNVVEATMLLHQMHYFVYCYAVVVLLATNEIGGAPFSGLWFAAGWVTYLSAEILWRRFNPNAVFLAGHACLVAILLLMWLLQPWPAATLALWVLSGFGGGSVYCLTIMHRTKGFQKSRLEASEDIGHLFGVVLAISLIGIWGDIALLPLAGSVFAALAALMMAANISYSHLRHFEKSFDHGS